MNTTSWPWLPLPHGGELTHFDLVAPDTPKSTDLDVECSPRVLGDLEMIGLGAYSPLTGFMDQLAWKTVVEDMSLPSGELWPIPITLQLPGRSLAPKHRRVRLKSKGVHLATLEIAEVFEVDLDTEANRVYGTTSTSHPGVAALLKEGPLAVAGSLSFHVMPRGYRGTEYYKPNDTRRIFAERGWRSIVAFQTRNPVHRAHEYLHKVALEIIDGLFLNPLVGATKADDIPAGTRMAAYRALLQNYYPSSRVLLGVYPAPMRYAGPREAVLHAIARKNYGCTHFIVGRDHAGVGEFYETYASQKIFDIIDPSALGIQVLKFEHSFYCKRCEQVASRRTCPHGAEHHLHLSGTAVRRMLSDAAQLPPQFSRAEVAQILHQAYAEFGQRADEHGPTPPSVDHL